MVFKSFAEPHTTRTDTNTEAALYTMEEQMRILEGFEELYLLAFDGRVLEKDFGTIAIPGLLATKTLQYEKTEQQGSENQKTGNQETESQEAELVYQWSENQAKKGSHGGEVAICTSMTPQGLCVVGKYLLISAYCYTKTHNSVIYVLNKDTQEFVKEVVLDGIPHTGGLAYDKEHQMIWVSTYRNGKASASCFSFKALERYDLEEVKGPITYTYEYDLYTLERDSFMTYADGYLYVGYFSVKTNGVVQKFKIDKNGGLATKSGISIGVRKKIALPEEIKEIPKKIQGIAIYQDKILMTQSYGLTKSSLFVHNDSDSMYRTDGNSTVNKISMPQKVQQIYIDGNELYVLFESAAYAYRAQPLPKVDRVLKLKLSAVLEGDF